MRVISLGAGVQSSALYLMACRDMFDHRPDYAVFADTQDESSKTYAWLDRLVAHEDATIPVIRATAGKLSEEVLRSQRDTASGFVPIPTYIPQEVGRERQGRRQCTRSHKVEVVYQAVRALMGLKPRQRTEEQSEVWIGISTDEASRAKPSRYPLLRHRWPLLYDVPMSRGACAQWLAENGYGIPPKSSCVYCPFRSDRDWIAMKRDDPASFAAAVAFERDMRAIDPRQYIHDSCKPLGEVDFNPDKTLDLFQNECEGLCGV